MGWSGGEAGRHRSRWRTVCRFPLPRCASCLPEVEQDNKRKPTHAEEQTRTSHAARTRASQPASRRCRAPSTRSAKQTKETQPCTRKRTELHTARKGKLIARHKKEGSPPGINNTGPSHGANVVTPSKRQRSAGPAPPAQTHSCPRRGTHHGRQGCSTRNLRLPAGAADRPAPARGLPPCRPSPHRRGPSPCGGCIVTRARGADRYHPRPRRFRPLVTGHVTHRGGGGARPQTPPPRSLLKPPPAHGRHRYSGAG